MYSIDKLTAIWITLPCTEDKGQRACTLLHQFG